MRKDKGGDMIAETIREQIGISKLNVAIHAKAIG